MSNPDAAVTFVVVTLRDEERERSFFLKIGIKWRNTASIDPQVFYVRHGLETCSPPISVEEPFGIGKFDVSSVVPLRSLAYSFAHNCSTHLISNFSQSPASRKFPAFPCEMTIKHTLLVDGKIYVFGSETPGVISAYSSPLDSDTPVWEPLPLPPAARLRKVRYVAASLGKTILILNVDYQLQTVYDPKLQTWTHVNYKGLLPLFCKIIDYPMTVEEHNTIYWLDSKMNIRAFNYLLCKHYLGPIVGFAHEPIVRGRDTGVAALIHLTGRLFCLVWKADDINLHLTLLHVSPDLTLRSTNLNDHHLFVNVVFCFHHRTHADLYLNGAFKL